MYVVSVIKNSITRKPWKLFSKVTLKFNSWLKYLNIRFRAACRTQTKIYDDLFSDRILDMLLNYHCVKSVQIRSFCWSVFSRIRTENGEIQSISPYSVGIRENRDQKKLLIWTLFTPCFPYFPVFSQNVGKYGPEETYVFGHFSLCEIIGFKASSRNLILVFLQHI